MKQLLTFLLAFIAGGASMYVYTAFTTPTQPQLERVTIMRPVANESVPNPVEKINAVGDEAPQPPAQAAEEKAVVEFVYDGDTVRLQDKRKVRLIGIDTPEMKYGAGEPECYAREAKKMLESYVLNKEIVITSDKEEKDRYGRLLRYVYVGTADGRVFVNNALVQSGGGLAKRYAPNTAQAETLEASMAEAQTARRGLWGVCK